MTTIGFVTTRTQKNTDNALGKGQPPKRSNITKPMTKTHIYRPELLKSRQIENTPRIYFGSGTKKGRPSHRLKKRHEIRANTSTVSQTDAGFLGVDVEQDPLVADFTLGGQADQASYVGVGRRLSS